MSLYEVVSRPLLASPYMVMALEGWIDAGLGSANAVARILEQTEMETVAVFDTDTLLDHRARRPTMHLVDGVNTGLSWPAIELRVGADANGTEALYLFGAEPDHNWRSFTSAVLDLMVDLGVGMVVGLGAYPAPTPHTRPPGIVSTATTAELAHQVGFLPNRVDVPAGIQAAIERACAERGVPAVGLGAQVPHYAAGMPFPDAAAALLAKLEELTGLTFAPGDLADDGERTRNRLDELIAGNPEHLAMISQLEAHYDAVNTIDEMTLVEGDDLVAEVEKFLREN